MNWQLLKKPILLGLLMLIAAGLTVAATPTKHMADEGPKIDLEQMIPKSFGRWQLDPSVAPITVAPDVQAKLDEIYNQTLARTYVNDKGQRVMLSIAYGGDQSDAMRAHRPEVCYAGQGFQIVRALISQMVTDFGILPVKRLIAINGARHEPISYWIVVGDQVVHDGLGQKLAQLRYGLTGKIPDGMLVRVSTIDRNEQSAFHNHDEFVKDLFNTLAETTRTRVGGGFRS